LTIGWNVKQLIFWGGDKMDWEPAFEELLTSKTLASDPVKLVQGAPLEGLDLRGLVELETRPNGGMRVRLIDRGAIILEALKQGAGMKDPEAENRMDRFIQSLAKRSEELSADNSGNVISINRDLEDE